MFRGFTLRVSNYETFGQEQDTIYGTKKAGTHTFVIKPDGSTEIHVYYSRNTYSISIYTNQVDPSTSQSIPNNRKFEVDVLLSEPLNDANIAGTLLKDGTNTARPDAGSTATNTGIGTFKG